MKKPFLEAGQIVSTHGVRGELKIMPWADDPEFLLDFDTIYLGGKPCRVVSSRVQKTCVLMKLEGIDDVDAAARLRGQTVCIRREDAQLPEGAMFIADLIGLKVLCGDETIGKVTEILQRPGNDVYVVKGAHEYLIPAVPEFILERDPDEGYIRVRLIEGMRTAEIRHYDAFSHLGGRHDVGKHPWPRTEEGTDRDPRPPDPGLHDQPAESGG